MSRKTGTSVRNAYKRARARKKAPKGLLSTFFTTAMVFLLVSSGDGVVYGTRAIAQTMNEQATSDVPTNTESSGDSGGSGETDPSPDGGSSDDVLTRESEDETIPHEAVMGSLPVRLSFTLDGEQSAPVPVTVRLQRRVQAWDPDTSTWSEIDDTYASAGWEDVVDEQTGMPVAVHLSALEDLASILATSTDNDLDNDGADYLFGDLPVQTVTEDGVYNQRFEYRALVMAVDGIREDIADANAAFESRDAGADTQTYTVRSDDTRAKTANYTVTVSCRPGLQATGDAPKTDAAMKAVRVITIDGTTVEQNEQTGTEGDGESGGEEESADDDGESDLSGGQEASGGQGSGQTDYGLDNNNETYDADDQNDTSSDSGDQTDESDESGEGNEQGNENGESEEPSDTPEGVGDTNPENGPENGDGQGDGLDDNQDGGESDGQNGGTSEDEPSDVTDTPDTTNPDDIVDQATGEGDVSDTRGPATTDNTITADLPVTVSFTKDGENAGPYAITLQLQSRTQQWYATEGSWGELSEWDDVEGKSTTISSGYVKDPDETTYTFEDLVVETSDSEGKPSQRTEYRVVETMVAGAALHYDATTEGILTYICELTLDDVTYDVSAKVTDEAMAKAVDTDDGKGQASVQTARIDNVLTEHQGFVGFFMNLFGLRTNRQESTRSTGEDEQPPTPPTPTHNTDEGTKTYTYTIHNDTINYSDNGEIKFEIENLTADTQIVVRNKDHEAVSFVRDSDELGGSFAVFANDAEDVTIELTVPEDAEALQPKIIFSTPHDGTETNSTNLCENYANDQAYYLADGMWFYSQQAVSTMSLNKLWRDNAATKPATITGTSMGLKIQAKPKQAGTNWSDEYPHRMDSGTGNPMWVSVPANPDTKSDTGWTWVFNKKLYTHTHVGTEWVEVDYRLAETAVPAGYVASYDSNNNLVNTIKQDLTYTISWMDNDDQFHTRLGFKALLEQLMITKGATGQENPETYVFEGTDDAIRVVVKL